MKLSSNYHIVLIISANASMGQSSNLLLFSLHSKCVAFPVLLQMRNVSMLLDGLMDSSSQISYAK